MSSRSAVPHGATPIEPPGHVVGDPRYDESPTELRARLEAMQNLVIDVAHTHDDLKMHDLAEVLRRAPSERSRATWIRSSCSVDPVVAGITRRMEPPRRYG
jgi:hypothetical protein